MITLNNTNYYITKEVATILGIGTNRVSQLRQEGKIKAKQLGPKKFLYSEKNVKDYLEGKEYE